MATIDTLLTAEEFLQLPDSGCPTELVQGRIVEVPPPNFRHGEICVNTVVILRDYLRPEDRGRVVCNDSGVITQRGPDTVRGMDVGYYSYERLPRNMRPTGYPAVSPDVAFEVKSPSDRRSEILTKVAEYLRSGVLRVCVLDPQRETITVYSPDEPEICLTADQMFELPEIFPGLSVLVAEFFK